MEIQGQLFIKTDKGEIIEVVSKVDYVAKYFPITLQAVEYNIKKGVFDTVSLKDTISLVAMTEHTRRYVPNTARTRGSIGSNIIRT